MAYNYGIRTWQSRQFIIELNPQQKERYQAHLALPGFDDRTQFQLSSSSVAILGLGGAGSIAAAHLTASGIGKIVLTDNQNIQFADLLHPVYLTELDLGRNRANAYAEKLAAVNLDTNITGQKTDLNPETIEEVLADCDLVIDCLSDWNTKLLLSDTCMQKDLPLVHGSISNFRWQCFVMVPRRSCCLRCALTLVGLEDMPISTAGTKNFSPLASMLGAVQATEALKYLAKLGATPATSFMQYDGLRSEFYTSEGLIAQKDCPDCSRSS